MPPLIRVAAGADVGALETIEDEADRLLVELLRPSTWFPAERGATRAAAPGFLLVAAETPDGEAVGFAHVLEVDGQAHLEQLSVLRAHARRGHGRRLVEAARSTAAERGHDRITLRTYADVPWNAPFSATCGFHVSEPDTAFLRDLVETEARLGLHRLGRRVQMTALLDEQRASAGIRRGRAK